MPSDLVAIIDIGSNSIKVLIAERNAAGEVLPRHTRTLDARISAGIDRSEPRLTEEGMGRGLAAIQSLLADADSFAVTRRVLVATSAVRDARNGADFRNLVRQTTGEEIRILTGEEEARLIGRGLTCDPALRHLRDFYVFDLGGGSLECLAFRDRQVVQAVSLPLGCVRLTERFVPDPNEPLSASAAAAIAAHVRAQIASAAFAFSLPAAAVAIGTGGTVSTARAILAGRSGKTLADTSPVVAASQLRELLATLGALPLPARRQVSGLPPARADVFPAALATMVALVEIGGFPALHHSLYNLRYGLAADALGVTCT